MSLARDTLEQIDVAKLLIERYSDVCDTFTGPLYVLMVYMSLQTFQLALTTDDVKYAAKQDKIASLLGVEG